MRVNVAPAMAILTLSGLLLSGCGLPMQDPATYGSGGQNALPDMSSSLTGVSVYQTGKSSAGANDRSGTTIP